MKKRVEWIDELKGFILILVCCYHIKTNNLYFNTLLNTTMAFRMVTFFFLSGMLFNGGKKYSIFIKHKIKSLLIPYILLSIFFSLLDGTLYKSTINSTHLTSTSFLYSDTINLSPIEYFYWELCDILLFGDATPVTRSLWFVFTLFVVNCTFYFLHNKKKYIIILFSTICLILGWICNINNINLLFNLQTALTLTFFFSLGYLFKFFLHTSLTIQQNIVSILILVPIYLYSININGIIDMHGNHLGDNLPFFLISTISGIFLIINIFILLNKVNYFNIIKGVLRNISRNALIILVAHFYASSTYNILYKFIPYKNEDDMFLKWGYVLFITFISIPLFRNKLHFLIGKEKITIKESLSIK